MNITIHASFLPHTNASAAIAFYRELLGFEVRLDVGRGDMRWITMGPVGQPETSLVLEPPAMDSNLTDSERQTILELIAKGSYARVLLATDDLESVFARVEASGAEIVQEPLDQPYGVRDCAFRDPSGNLIRLQQL